MSLKSLKKKLNIDQQNILVCTVVQDFDAYVNIRTQDGKIVRASKPLGSEYESGSQLKVMTDKRSYSIIGASIYADYAAEKGVAL
jgi:hypothetical protein